MEEVIKSVKERISRYNFRVFFSIELPEDEWNNILKIGSEFIFDQIIYFLRILREISGSTILIESINEFLSTNKDLLFGLVTLQLCEGSGLQFLLLLKKLLDSKNLCEDLKSYNLPFSKYITPEVIELVKNKKLLNF